MVDISSELVTLLKYLLPGFLAAWVFYGFTAHEKSSQFERVVQAVIFTLIVQSILALLTLTGLTEDLKTNTSAQDFLSVVIAIFIGFIFALFANRDWLHAVLRKIGFTKQTAYPSEWFGTFNKYDGYIVLHLNDGRRIYGWPKEWPPSHDQGHFYIVEVSWLEGETEEHYLGDKGVQGILIAAHEVRWVEFMKKED